MGNARRGKLLTAAKAWNAQLVDLSGRNTLLYYKDLSRGTLDLSRASGANEVAVSDLLASRTVRLSTLFGEPKALAAAAKRGRTIAAKAQENYEERGLQTLFLAWGIATWTNASGTAIPAAPILLSPALLTARGGAGEDFDVVLSGEWTINPTLLHLLRTEYRVDFDPDELLDLLDDDDPAPDPTEMWARLTKAACPVVPGFSLTARVVVGNFSYAKLPMVEDIRSAAETGLLEAHDLLAAIAGDEQARAAVRQRHPEVALDEPDRVPPADEFLVLDADASQSYAINAVVAGGDLVIEGPPGTGKSQTIANLIATLAARHKRILFVAEKRAAIEAVLDRLNRVGLADLVLDLHDGAGNRRKLAQDLAKAIADHSSIALPKVIEDQARLVRRREALVARARALHDPRPPWGLSVYDLQSGLLGLPVTAANGLRLRGSVLDALDANALDAAREELRRYVELGGLTLARGLGSPWFRAFQAGSISSTEQAAAALDATSALARRTLPTTLERLRGLLGECGLQTPATVQAWAELLGLLDQVTALLARCDPAIYEASLPDLAAALEPVRRGAFARFGAWLGNSAYRRARRQVVGLWRDGKPTTAQLHEAVTAASSQLIAWRSRSADGGTPRLPADLAGTERAFDQLNLELRAVGAYVGSDALGALAADEVQARLEALLADQVTLYKLPELNRLWGKLYGRGLREVVHEASIRNLDPDSAVALLQHTWLASILERISLTDPVIGAFDAAAQHRVVADYADADRTHITVGPARVRRAVAEWAILARDNHPAESDVVEKQARLKRGHLPVRQLFHAAPHVVSAMKPCWAMSPLVVAQLLPPERCFDVVVFDEASQVTPADAVGALLRAERAVVAGDTRQLPPTRFFASTSDEDDGDGDVLALTSGLESVLDVMGALLPPPRGTRTLGWHYRSRDERLIAFSNAQPSLYDWSLTTFPGVKGDDCIAHELVPWREGCVGQEDSVADEVTRVVTLILDHARNRSDQSLGVIAMGIKHANRIGEALRRARGELPELDRWFDRGPEDRGGKEPFFVKNLERVQGDERDAIILTIGYGKSDDGRMLYRFGPLNFEGGERRLNVAVTRARDRVTVVSSFSSADLDPTKLKAEGAKMLGRYLAYAESRGANLGDVANDKPVLNPFERDVRDQLTTAGIPLVAQFGCSGYWIDYAAQHPTKPGCMVLAIECDGASYHSSATARDRDRLRQEHLEGLGWSFHRIWSTEWFHNREGEICRAVNAWNEAVSASDRMEARRAAIRSRTGPASATSLPVTPATSFLAASAPAGRRRGPRPPLARGLSIDQHSQRNLVALIRWIESDTLLRTEEELIAEAMEELGYRRRGARIVDALERAVQAARSR